MHSAATLTKWLILQFSDHYSVAGGIARAGFTCRLRGAFRVPGGSIHAEIVRNIIIYTPDCPFPLTCKKMIIF